MSHTFHLTPVSSNKKVGPIPVTTSSRSTCPDVCPLKANGCYPEYGPLKIHWDAVSSGKRGGSLDDLCTQIKTLPKGQLFRFWQAGDFPGDGKALDTSSMLALIRANQGRRGFGYSHYDPTVEHNANLIRSANERGLTINLSANNLEHADQLADTGAGPVVTILPMDAPRTLKTPAGRHVAVCPAEYTDGLNCARCGVCAVEQRKTIIGFRAHGSGKAKAQKVFMMRQL